jgi:hypothetical protein
LKSRLRRLSSRSTSSRRQGSRGPLFQNFFLRRLPLAILFVGVAAAVSRPPLELVGEWQGDGRVLVTWCKQDRLSIRLFLGADGKVSGSVGDALIAAGSVRKNNRLLNWLGNPEYVIDATLDGELVAAEGIRRKTIKLLVDLHDHQLQGGFHTDGDKTGGKESMIMSGTDVRLSRVLRLDTEIGQIHRDEFIGQKGV